MQPRPGADAEQGPISGMATPYPASWIDHLIAWIGRLPGPAWVFYVLAIVLLILVSHGVRWLDGSLPRGEFDPARVAEAPLILYFLALMHSLNSVARRSLDAFRPALAISEPQVARLEYELTTMPRAAGYISAAVGSVVGILSILSSPASWGISVGTSPLTLGYTVVASAVSMAFAAAFVFHTLRQLRLVSRIHRMATNINLFEKMPVYAFSALTARTGIGIVIIIYYYVYLFYFLHLFGPTYRASLIDSLTTVVFLLLAAASFVLPLNGMHHRLGEEKARLAAEADRRFEAALKRLHERLDSDSFERMDDLNKALASLVIERDALARISTWPWRPETLRSFLTSVALPVLIWVVTAFLGRLLEV